jgi:hypothetical protein
MDDSDPRLSSLRALRDSATDPALRAALDAAIAALRPPPRPLLDLSAAQMGDVAVGDVAVGDMRKGSVTLGGDARVFGPAIGLNLGTVIYGRGPDADERRRLVWYLEGLAARMAELPLGALDERLGRGAGVALPRVYVPLATESRVAAARGPEAELRRFFEGDDMGRPLRPAHSPDHALPHAALYQAQADAGPALLLERHLAAEEAVRRHQRLVLCGGPGSGKSTFLRHLAWTLAARELEPERAAAAGGERRLLLPILVPLPALAARLAREGGGDRTVYAALRDELHAYCTHQIEDALSAALSSGAALLLFDGLDEAPAEGAEPGGDRLAALRAVRSVARRYPRCPVVVTCRTEAFAGLEAELGWPVETLAPLTPGQVRHFVRAWHAELAAAGHLDADGADRAATALLEAIFDPAAPQLRALAATPLLLTLMVLVLARRGELPRDRPQLYGQMLDLLLRQWDAAPEGRDPRVAIAEADLPRVRAALDRLAYQMHRDAPGPDWRGRLSAGDLLAALLDGLGGAPAVGRAARAFDHLAHRSGVLAADGVGGYAFAHLALQAFCAGSFIAAQGAGAVGLALSLRADPRWQEPIMLGLGLAEPLVLDRLLADLADREEAGTAKAPERRHRDLILAAAIGADRGWQTLADRRLVRVGPLRAQLREGLVELLADPAQPLPVAERVRAGLLLGDLGDPRFPVSPEQWREAVRQAHGGAAAGYFCPLPPRAGAPDLWVARFPIVNAQLLEWLRHTGRAPWPLARDGNFSRPNQPAAGVSWLLATAFCAWLSDELGVTVRLPSEAEWELAAYGGDGRPHPWGAAGPRGRAAIKDDLRERGWPYPTPVGCYPAGASAAGALDMAGNVWEWTADLWQGDGGPAGAEPARVLRGGGFRSGRAKLRGRIKLPPHLGVSHGFRIVLVRGEAAPAG